MGFEEEDGAVSEVEVDEVICFVGYKGAEVASYDAMPGWTFALVESLLDVHGDVLLDAVLGHGFLCNINSLLLHILGHICRLDLRLQLLLLLCCSHFG